eukprot:jgi/Botrbrau1/3588/Bobra.0078s0041.2
MPRAPNVTGTASSVKSEKARSAFAYEEQQDEFKHKIWWGFLLLCAIFPIAVCSKSGFWSSWVAIGIRRQAMLDFALDHPIFVPNKTDVWRNYTETMRCLIGWQRGMEARFSALSQVYPVKAVTQDATDFLIGSLSSSSTRCASCQNASSGRGGLFAEGMALASMVALVPLQFSDSVHLAVLMLQSSVLHLLMGLRVRTLADAIQAAVDELWQAELDLALLEPRDDEMHEIVSQTLTILKVKAFRQRWEGVDLGFALYLPLMKTYITLRPSFFVSVLAWAMYRATEVILSASCPSAPRIGDWLYSAVRGDKEKLRQHRRQFSLILSGFRQGRLPALTSFGDAVNPEAAHNEDGQTHVHSD